MRHFSSAKQLEKERAKARKQRIKQGQPPTVLYFHQVDDPYSHLAIQKLNLLRQRYQVDFQPYLTSKPDPQFQGSQAHFDVWARRDAQSVAADYGTVFAPKVDSPEPRVVQAATARLSEHLTQDDFAAVAFEMGEALWRGHPIEGSQDLALGTTTVQLGNAKRKNLGHYQGAMFYFDGEWFWGLDRLRLLEARLQAEGFDSQAGPPCVPEPSTPTFTNQEPANVLLEYFPSLRSPYTAIGHARVLDLVNESAVNLAVRPVLPMMMRGIPAPRAKQRYILSDAAREGRAHGTPMGRVVDPFGDPVKRAFALFPGADKMGLGMEYVTAYLQAAWVDGVDITTEQGLRKVAHMAGLEWDKLNHLAQLEDWNAVLNDNLAALTLADLWGVPSFRVSGGDIETPYVCWGQDRIWRVAREIAARSAVA